MEVAQKMETTYSSTDEEDQYEEAQLRRVSRKRRMENLAETLFKQHGVGSSRNFQLITLRNHLKKLNRQGWHDSQLESGELVAKKYQ